MMPEQVRRFMANVALKPWAAPEGTTRALEARILANDPTLRLAFEAEVVPVVAFARDPEAGLFVHRRLKRDRTGMPYEDGDAWRVSHSGSGLALPGVWWSFASALAVCDGLIAACPPGTWQSTWSAVRRMPAAVAAVQATRRKVAA